MSNFKELIKQFGAAAGVPGLELDSDGLCRITIDGNTVIDFELADDDTTLLLTGHVLADVEEAGEDAFVAALLLNTDVALNKGSFLSYDGAEDELLLLRRLDNPAMHYGAFEALLNDFAGYIEHCRTALPEGLLDDEDDEDGDDLAGTGAVDDPNLVFRL